MRIPVSVEFPFSNLQGQKRCPGLVLSADPGDVLLARLTTHPPRNVTDIALRDRAEAGSPKASTVRLTKLATVDRRLIHHCMGQLRSGDAQAGASALETSFSKIAATLRQQLPPPK